MEEATFLTKFADTVTIIHRREEFRASKIMADRALSNSKIEVRWNTVVDEILGTDGSVSGVQLRDVVTGDKNTLDVTGVFIAIGHDPRTALFADQVALDEHGYVRVEAQTTRTSLPGVFAAGDVVDRVYRQAVTAAGTGCAAALDAERYLAALGH
jgi:thioredoxin reductase (NADPH)